MAIIDKKLIHFKKWNTFISSEGVNGNYTTPSTSATSTSPALYGQIKETSIVFIQDVQKIWTHGKLYDCSTPDLSAYLTAEDLAALNDFMNNSSVSKSGETLTVKINNSTQSLTNTWRSISDKTNGTSSDISASEKAVAAAYSLAASKTSNTGTVTSVTPGTGLTGTSSDAAITTSGTINLKTAGTSEIGGIKVATVGTAASGANTTVNANKFAVHVDSDGLGYVAIPAYTNNSGDITGVTAGNGLTGGATSGNATLNVGAGTGITVAADSVSVNLKDATALTIDAAVATTTSGRVYPVAVDKSGYLAVNVPWKNDDTKSFTITATAKDDDVVVLAGTNGTNATTYTASHAKTFGNTTAPYTAKYTSGNSTTSISGYGSSATIKIPQITVDEYGHVRAGADESVTITMPTAITETTVKSWGFTKNTGTYSKPANGIPKTDLEQSVQTSLNNADAAYQFATSQIPDSKLIYNSPTCGTLTPIDLSMSNLHSANRLAFCNTSGVTIEYTNDGGNTWNDYGLSDYEITGLLSGCPTRQIYIGKSLGSKATVNDQLRVTLYANNMNLYTHAKKILFDITTNGAIGTKVKVEYALGPQQGYDSNTFIENATYDITGWSGWNSFPINMAFGNGHLDKIRMTFFITGVDSTYHSYLGVNAMYMTGETYWVTPSPLARTGHLYEYDAYKNAKFPGELYANGVKVVKSTDIKSLTVGSKRYDTTGDVTITASDLGLSAALKYCGVTTSALSDGATTNPIVISGSNHTATAGCVVFYGDKEYVFNGSSWEELGYARTLTLNTITSGTNSSSVEVSAKGHTHNVPKTSTDGVSVASSSHTHTVTADGSVSSTFTGSEVTSGTSSNNTTSVAKGTHTHDVDATINNTTNVVSMPNANHTHTISIGNATATITIGDKTSGTPSSNTTSVSQGGHSHTASATADNTTNRVSVSASGHGHTVSGGSHKHSVTATGSVTSSFTGSEVTSGVPDTTNVSSVALGSHKHTVSAATDNTTNRVSVPNTGHTHNVSIGDVSATISIGSKTSGAVSTSTSGHTTTVAAQNHTHSVTGTIADGGASHKHSYTPSGSVSTSVTLSGTRDASTGCLTITASASSSFSGTAANTGNTTATHSHTFSNGSASATSTTGTTVPSTSHTHSTNIGSPSVTVSVGSKTTGAADSTNTVSVATGAHTHGMGTAVANNTSNVVNVPNTSHTHSVTAAGSVSSTFTGTSASTDSKTPSITIGAADSSVSVATGAHTHSVPASSSTVSVPNTSHTHTTSIGNPSVSVAIGNKTTGAADTTNTTNVTTAAHTHTASATTSGNRVSVPNTSHTHTVTATGSVSSTFTGLSATTNSITGTTTVASQSHTHTASASSSGTTVANHTHTHSVTPTGSIS